jgi:hypothetical protein
MKAYYIPPDVANEPIAPGTKVPEYVPPQKDGVPGTINWRTPSQDEVITNARFNAMYAAAYGKLGTDTEQLKKTADLGEAQTKEQYAPQLAQAEIAEKKGAAAASQSEASLRNAQRVALNTANDQQTIQSNAQQLVEGTADASLLSKRSKSYDATIAAANAYSLAKYGVPFDIAKASSDYRYATNMGTQNTLKYLNSLVGHDNKGGNLAQLVDQSNKISRTEFPALNNAEAWAKLATGDPGMAAYKTTVTEIADQVAKILQGGGAGSGGTSDAKLRQAQDLFQTGFTKKQITAVANDLRPLLGNRKAEMIGDNRYLQRWSMTQAAGPAGVQQPTAGATQQIRLANGNIGVVQNGAWVDTGQKAPQ